MFAGRGQPPLVSPIRSSPMSAAAARTSSLALETTSGICDSSVLSVRKSLFGDLPSDIGHRRRPVAKKLSPPLNRMDGARNQ